MNTVTTINATVGNLSETARRAVCFTLAVLIVGTGLTLGAVGADVAFHSAQAQATVA